MDSGTNRTRTYDPLLVRQMLSQLSYDPLCLSSSLAWRQNIIYSYFRWMSTLFLIFFWYFYFTDRNHVKNGLFTWFLHNLFFYIFSNFIEISYAIFYATRKNPALQDSPPAAGRFCDKFPFRRSAILPEGLFYFIGDFIEISYEIKIFLPKSEWFLLWVKSHLSIHLSLEDPI